MRLILSLFIMLTTTCTQLLAADLVEKDFPGIETLMSQQELQTTGVGKLTDAQVRALNDWLINYTAKDAPALIQNNTKVKAVQNKAVTSRIVGTFKGWRGDTEVTLDNGEVWQQRHDTKWIVRLENPEVVIEKNILGFYKMTFIASGKAVGVKRIE